MYEAVENILARPSKTPILSSSVDFGAMLVKSGGADEDAPALGHVTQDAHGLEIGGPRAFELPHDLLLLVRRDHEVTAVALVADDLHAGDGLVLAFLHHELHLGLVLPQGLHARVHSLKQASPAHMSLSHFSMKILANLQ